VLRLRRPDPPRPPAGCADRAPLHQVPGHTRSPGGRPMQTLSLSRYPRPAKPRPAPVTYYVIDEPVDPVPVAAAPRRPPAVTTHDRAVMRDLVLGAFLGPQHFREDDGKRVAAYTIENTRDAVPARILEE